MCANPSVIAAMRSPPPALCQFSGLMFSWPLSCSDFLQLLPFFSDLELTQMRDEGWRTFSPVPRATAGTECCVSGTFTEDTAALESSTRDMPSLKSPEAAPTGGFSRSHCPSLFGPAISSPSLHFFSCTATPPPLPPATRTTQLPPSPLTG